MNRPLSRFLVALLLVAQAIQAEEGRKGGRGGGGGAVAPYVALAEKAGIALQTRASAHVEILGTDEDLSASCLASGTGAFDRFCDLMKLDPETFGRGVPFRLMVLSSRADFMKIGQLHAQQEGNPKILDYYKGRGNDSMICVACEAKGEREAGPGRAAHALTHWYIRRYFKGDETKVPGWLWEGLGASMEEHTCKIPRTHCAARVGYEGDELKNREVEKNWAAAVYAVAQEYQEKMKKRDELKDFRGLAQMMSRAFDKLTAQEIQVAWHVTRQLIRENPEGYKAFVDALAAGTKQADAFEAAFGMSIEQYEKAWLKEALKKPSPPKRQ